MQVGIAGIAWYPPDQYLALRALMVDGDKLPQTHAAWLVQAELAEERLRREGRQTVRAMLDIDNFRQFVERHNHVPDAHGRIAFANWCARETQRRQVKEP